MFYIPKEIQTSIYKQSSKLQNVRIKVANVLTQAISKTQANLRCSMPIQATQGCCFKNYKNLLDSVYTTNKQAKKFLEGKAQSVNYCYCLRF